MSVLTQPNQIEAFRIKTLIKGIQLEARGLKMSRSRSCLAIARAQLGLGRNAKREDVIAQLQEHCEALLA
jgi:hypothetical protein